jgi:hypothetical protein
MEEVGWCGRLSIQITKNAFQPSLRTKRSNLGCAVQDKLHSLKFKSIKFEIATSQETLLAMTLREFISYKNVIFEIFLVSIPL